MAARRPAHTTERGPQTTLQKLSPEQFEKPILMKCQRFFGIGLQGYQPAAFNRAMDVFLVT